MERTQQHFSQKLLTQICSYLPIFFFTNIFLIDKLSSFRSDSRTSVSSVPSVTSHYSWERNSLRQAINSFIIIVTLIKFLEAALILHVT